MIKNKSLILFIGVALFIIQACAATSSISNSFNRSDQQDICDNTSNYDFLDLDKTEVQLWDQKDGLYSLNNDEKLNLLSEYGSRSDTFCDYEVSAETQEILDEVQGLEDDGKAEEAKQKFEDYVHKLEQEVGGVKTTNKLAKIDYLGKDATYKYIRDMLSIAGKAELLGLDDLANEAKDEATNTFDEYGNKTIENVTDFNEAMDIAAQAQLLGLEDLSDTALYKVREIAKKMVDEGFSSFDICSATEEDVSILFKLAALSQLLGLEGNRDRVDEVIEYAKKWKEIQEKRKNGETVPECDRNSIKIDHNFGNIYMQVTGSIFTCDSSTWQIEISLNGNVDDAILNGQGGTSFTLTEGKSGVVIIPVTGTASFGDDVVPFQDPITFSLEILSDGENAEIRMGSTGQGSITTPIGPIMFVILPTTNSEIIPLGTQDCGQ